MLWQAWLLPCSHFFFFFFLSLHACLLVKEVGHLQGSPAPYKEKWQPFWGRKKKWVPARHHSLHASKLKTLHWNKILCMLMNLWYKLRGQFGEPTYGWSLKVAAVKAWIWSKDRSVPVQMAVFCLAGIGCWSSGKIFLSWKEVTSLRNVQLGGNASIGKYNRGQKLITINNLTTLPQQYSLGLI